MTTKMGTTHDNEYLPQERAARIAWLIANGAMLSTNEIAEMLSMTKQGVWCMMGKISRVIPIFRGDDGRWQVCK